MFLSNNEKKISEMYLKKGFVLHNINNLEDALSYISRAIEVSGYKLGEEIFNKRIMLKLF